MSVILAYIRKEFLQFFRDKKLRAILLLAPILQLILLGYAATLDIKIVRTAILDYDNSETSRLLALRIRHSNFFHLKKILISSDEIDKILKSGNDVIFVIPRDFQKRIYRNEFAQVKIIIDAVDGNKANIVSGYAANLTLNFYKKIYLETLPYSKDKEQFNPINLNIVAFFNPYLRARSFMLPAILGVILMIVNIALMSMAIVKEKETGAIEQIIAAPIRRYQFIAGKSIPFLLLSLIPATFQLLVIRYWFDIEIKGSLIFIYSSILIFIVSNIGLGLLVSTASKSQFQAMTISFFGLMLPILFISGFAFPIENMPNSIQLISNLLPAKYFLKIIRASILKGATVFELILDLLIMFFLGLSLLIFSILNFKKGIK